MGHLMDTFEMLKESEESKSEYSCTYISHALSDTDRFGMSFFSSIWFPLNVS